MRRSSQILAMLLVGCGPGRPNSGADSTATAGSGPTTSSTDDPGATGAMDGTGDAASDDGASDESGTPEACPEELVRCDIDCVNLWGNEGHCGECFHDCHGTPGSVMCIDYQCQPALWPCTTQDMGVATCAEACARAGESCNDTDAYCAGYVEVYLTDGPNDNDPQEDVDSCFQQFSGESSFQLACDEPIPWDFETGGRTVAGIACCCTQP